MTDLMKDLLNDRTKGQMNEIQGTIPQRFKVDG